MHIKSLSGDSTTLMDLSKLRKLKIMCTTPKILLFNLPVLYHLELHGCGATIIDATKIPMVSLKIRQGATNMLLVSISTTTESVYAATADKILYTDVNSSNLDYLYLPNCLFFASNIIKTSVYLSNSLIVAPIAPFCKLHFLPVQP